MGQTPIHKIFICTSCELKGRPCRPGYELITRLRAALDAAGPALGDEFEISGVACIAACDAPCTIGYQASKKAACLFGNVDPAQDIDELVEFAKIHQKFEDGWFTVCLPKVVSGFGIKDTRKQRGKALERLLLAATCFSGKIYPQKLRRNTLSRVPWLLMISDPGAEAPQ